jgi:methyl-accepting chemotaxis protein
MPTLKEVEAEVDDLSSVTPDIFSFRDAFTSIEEVSQTNIDASALRSVLSRFRGKIPDLLAFKRIRADAKDLAEILMLADVKARIARISSRNDLIAELTDELQVQVDKANSDATLLKRIKDGVNKATRTVEELKALVGELSATDASAKTRITKLLERLGNISSILNPDNA